MDYVAVFGIGSTNFRYTVANSRGEFVGDVSVESTRHRDLPAQLIAAIDELQTVTPHTLDAVGISCTGLVDSTAGVIRDLDTPAGETVDRLDIATPIDQAHGLPVVLANDCNAAALGEWWFGARDTHDCLVHVTFGTGIGGGIVEQGWLVRGEAGEAGEFGLLPVAPHSDLRSTGVRGAWEAICSGRGIPQYVAQRAGEAASGDAIDDGGAGSGLSLDADRSTWTAADVFDAAAAGDRFAQDCLDEIAQYNAAGIAAICNAVNPGVITLGGGVALNNPDWIIEGIESSLEEYLFVDPPTIQMTPLGDDIGLYGALAAVLGESADRSTGAVDSRSPVR
ncbi:ROK family protein [Halosimplex salinum]|uniref:ROK family protein n=1 Tax=Halosimplex salinum TaxID=1710538 RepID=UPI000F4744D0|nr:ROK family protein [Halosimplex salinum]